jgi:arylsulfatase A-like enzyme
LTPTLLDLLGIEPPAEINGVRQMLPLTVVHARAVRQFNSP